MLPVWIPRELRVTEKNRDVVPLRQETNFSFKWEARKNEGIPSALPQRQQNQRQLQPVGCLELEYGKEAEDTHGWQATFYSNHKANDTWWEFKVSVAKSLWALQTLPAKETSAASFSSVEGCMISYKTRPYCEDSAPSQEVRFPKHWRYSRFLHSPLLEPRALC